MWLVVAVLDYTTLKHCSSAMTFIEYSPYMKHCGRFHEGVRALLQNSIISGYLCTDKILPEKNPKFAPLLFLFVSFHFNSIHSI